MQDKQVRYELKRILRKIGSDPELVNKKLSSKHEDETELLLQHLAMSVEYLLMDAQASRNELFDIKRLIENQGMDDYH